MAYIAKIDIGGFKKGQEVPDELAIVWAQMFKESPVEKVKEVKSNSVVEEKSDIVEEKVEAKKVAKKKGFFG